MYPRNAPKQTRIPTPRNVYMNLWNKDMNSFSSANIKEWWEREVYIYIYILKLHMNLWNMNKNMNSFPNVNRINKYINKFKKKCVYIYTMAWELPKMENPLEPSPWSILSITKESTQSSQFQTSLQWNWQLSLHCWGYI